MRGAPMRINNTENERLRAENAKLHEWKQAAQVEAGIRRELQAEIAELRATLERYGSHVLTCTSQKYGGDGKCDCGWTALREGK